MEKSFRDIPLFVEVARQKSFTKASEILNIPIPTLSRRIAAMEAELELPLFHRSSRKIELTESGQILFEQCVSLVSEAEAAFERLQQHTDSPRGKVGISMPADVYHTYLRGVLSAFALKWPGIYLQMELSSYWVDLHGGPYDLNIRLGPLPDSDLIVRKLFSLQPKLYVAPGLLERYPRPEHPEELSEFPCISFSHHISTWSITRGKQNLTVRPRITHAVNTVALALDFALAGLGAAWLIVPLASKFEKTGQLVPLLEEWSPPGGVDLSLVMASNRLPKRVRLLVDHLVDHFAALSAGRVSGT